MRMPFPALIGDIGGTNARFAWLEARESALRPLSACVTTDHPSFAEALRATISAAGVQPKAVILCAAGPVDGAKVSLTNGGWTIDGDELIAEASIENGIIFNDFEALALSIPSFRADDLRSIGAVGTGRTDGALLVHGPGTGLGTAALVQAGGKWLAIASEGSHSDFAPVRDDEHAIWPFIEPRLGRITPESLISGPGLRRLHRARLAARGRERPDIDAADIIQLAMQAPNGEEAESARMFWRLAARFAGDVTLAFLARGGVFLAGGMLPRMVDFLTDPGFREIFEHKAPYEALMREIPVHLVMNAGVVLAGMADVARAPDRYAIDYVARAWRR